MTEGKPRYMPILNRPKIQSLLKYGHLVRNPDLDADGTFKVEAASYDLRVGTLLWLESDTQEVRRRDFDAGTPSPDSFTLQPGQMVFVVTLEDLVLPPTICGTVYSRNRLQKDNILALNAGHVDPGYDGPIMIRLVNLGRNG